MINRADRILEADVKNADWLKQERAHEVSRLEAILRADDAGPEEKFIAASQLEYFRELEQEEAAREEHVRGQVAQDLADLAVNLGEED